MLRMLTVDFKSFAKQDLPKEHRVLEPGSMTTQDFNPDRYVPLVSDRSPGKARGADKRLE